MNAPNPIKFGFTSLEDEVVLDELATRGEIPRSLSGSLLRVGPAKFEVGPTAYSHWFDGLSMLHRFSFENGKVSYANKFLESLAYRKAMARGRIALREFATMPSESKLARIVSNLVDPTTDNANVNISRMGGRVVALTETTHAMSFDPWTLSFTGELTFEDKLKAQVWTAHPHYDFQRKKSYNVMIAFGPRNSYKFYSMDDGSNTRALLCEIKSSRPSYVHSFAMTENYLVLTEHPLVVTSIKLKVGWSPFIENYRWEPARGTKMTIIRKDDGKIVAVREMDAFFTFHHVNAFEEGGHVVVDLVQFPDAKVIDALYLESLRATGHLLGTLERYRLPLSSSAGLVRSERLSTQPIELPTINYSKFSGRPYAHTYAVGATPDIAFDQIAKIDVVRGTRLSWHEDQCHPGEPIFVTSPDAKSEDDGLLLSLVFDSAAKRSFLLILDARDLAEKGRAFLPHHVPFGFHGQYFDKIRRPA